MVITDTKAEPTFIRKYNISPLLPPMSSGLISLVSQTEMAWSQWNTLCSEPVLELSLNAYASRNCAALLSRMGERQTDPSGLLQYLYYCITNVSEIDFITALSSIECRKSIVDQLERLDASNLTALLTARATGSSVSNEVTLEIDSHSESICTQNPLSIAE
ncbi:hypothetical protein TNCV_645011 [Trichonephila clavipes]|nr:hypothetical protein TNCV_645011 [Trichonephila clavipes]